MSEYRVYSNDIVINGEPFFGMSRAEIEENILKVFHSIDSSVFQVDVDVLYLLKPTVKNTIKVRIYRRIKE